MEGQRIGKVFRVFNNINVAAIELTDGDLNLGDKIHIKGTTSDFEMKVESMQQDGEEVDYVEEGGSVAIQVKEKVRPGDIVYKL